MSDHRNQIIKIEDNLTVDLNFVKQIERNREITLKDLARGHGVDKLIRNTVSELGEFCEAFSSETGEKPRDLNETSVQEAGDVVICAFALFFASGGTIETLVNHMTQKLSKWERTIERFSTKEQNHVDSV